MANDPTLPAEGAPVDAPPPSREQAFAARYSTQEKLLLAQAVYKLGAAKWEGISQLLIEHPCIADKAPEALEGMFSPQACEDGYVGLMTDIGINVPAEGGIKPHAKPHLRLAQTFYIARMAELKTSIAGYEARFATLMSEIQMIKSGEMDGAIVAELRAVLVKKFGKKLLDAWVPESADVGSAAEAGPVSEEQRRERDEAIAKEKKAAEVEKARAEKEREEAAAEERRKAEEAEAEAAAIGEKAVELTAPSALVQYSSPVDAPEETAEEAEEAPVEQEELLPPVPRRKKGGRSQKGVSMEKQAEPETEEAGVEEEAEAEADTIAEPAVEGKPEGKKRPKRGSAADEAPATEVEATPPAAAVPPTPAPGRSTRRGKEAAAAPAAETTDDVEMPEAPPQPQSRSTRKGKTQTPASDPALPQQSEDVEMEEEEDEAEPPAEEEAEAPQHDIRRRPSKPDVHVPTQSSRSRSKRPTTPAATAETKAASASPLTSEPDGASPPAETTVKPKSRSKTKAVPKRNSRGNKEAEAEEEEEEEQAAEEEASGPSKRGGNKRKAAVPPSGAPAGKRKGGRRGTSPAPTIATAPGSDVDPEEPEAEEAESSRGKRGSMPAPLLSASSAPRRGRPPKESPGLSARTRGSSPSASRRAQSVTSTASAATPKPGTGATAKRGRGRPSRAQVAAKDEEEEEGEGEDEEEEEEEEEEDLGGRAQRSKARGKGAEVEVAVSADGPKRSHARKPRAEDNVEVDMSAPAKRSHQKKVAEEPAQKKSQGKKGKAEEVEAPSRPKRESLRAPQTRPDPLVLGEGSEPPPSTSGSLSLSPKKERGEPAMSEGAPTTAGRTSLGGARRRKKDETPEERDQKRVVKLLMGLLDTVSAHKNGNVFQNPVRKSDAPDYFEIVKQPMDLKTMRLRIKNGQISTLDEFERDVHLIFANAMMYNEEGSQVYEMAEEMLKDAEGHLARFRVMQQDLGQ